MRFSKMISGAILMASLPAVLLTTSCKNDHNDNPEPDGACEVQLFDGDNFTDDHVTVKGPAEYADMSKLPGSDKNWDDEADSFKSGKNAIVTFWSEPNFKGDSVDYNAGAQNASIDGPRSMKIRCETN